MYSLTKLCTVSRMLYATPLPWLPILSNIAPPHIRHEGVSIMLLANIREKCDLPLYSDLFNHLLTSPVFSLLDTIPPQDMMVESAWHNKWSAMIVINHSLVTDPTI
ncbi:hypothetical protein KIL84_000791 [Mauremys mutica]|uniref:Uncharacterized protein n=1 Tax=Mauremys mutica TaxID=74926 RepID=A0A9D3WXW4_9SAUR|nr:hypothetical protein KIL84_000791 [Mauremys mutica]